MLFPATEYLPLPGKLLSSFRVNLLQEAFLDCHLSPSACPLLHLRLHSSIRFYWTHIFQPLPLAPIPPPTPPPNRAIPYLPASSLAQELQEVRTTCQLPSWLSIGLQPPEHLWLNKEEFWDSTGGRKPLKRLSSKRKEMLPPGTLTDVPETIMS